MNWIQSLLVKLLHIIPAMEKEITIKEAYTFQQNIMKNRIWYNGEPAELEQFFKRYAVWGVNNTRFWSAVPNSQIRKIHSGIVSMVIDRYKDMVTSDLTGIDFGEEGNVTPIKDLWEEIAEDNNFLDILSEAVQSALIAGDGAFKISTDEVSEYPIIQFYDMENVEYQYRYGRLEEIKYYTDYVKDKKGYRLQESYGHGYIHYKLYTDKGKECSLKDLEETKHLTDIEFDGDFIMGVPFMIFKSTKWKGRGKALFDTKSDVLDALDEVISQWLDAIRLGRIKRYIPEDLLPRDENTGEVMSANPFDNDFLSLQSSMDEGGKKEVTISQPQILYEAYVNSYTSYMDMVLQGIISPSTLGIDLKKTDNAESQREKEKITLHVRQKIIEAITETAPQLIEKVLMTNDILCGRYPGEYDAAIKFGEYASPDFDSTVETVSKARTASIMSIEKAVEELYGDTMTDEEKEEEIKRLKEEQGIVEVEEQKVGDDLIDQQNTINGDKNKLSSEGGAKLNGAQIQSLMNVITMVKQGSVTRNEAIAIITSTLGISRESAESFIENNGVNV